MRAKTMKLAYCGVLAALSLVVLFLTGVVPVATVALPAVAGCLLIAVVAETSIRYGLGVYAVVCVLGALIVPDREALLLYIVFFGYYPVLYGVLGRVQNTVLRWIAKFAVFNAAMTLEVLAAIWVLSIPAAEIVPYGGWMIPVFVLALNAVFLIYDLAMNGLIVTYIRRLHPLVAKYFK